MKKLQLLLMAMVLPVALAVAQDDPAPEPYKPSKTQFMIRGYGHAGLEFMKNEDGTENTFVGSTFAPIFLFKHNDRLIFEAELEFTFEENQLEVGFEYANLSYILNDYMTLRMGKFLLPFGTFGERLHPSWINKFSNMPLGFGHDGIAPSSGTGVELRGAIPVGNAKLLYYAYATNGPRLNTGVDAPDEAGQIHYDNFFDNNNNKALGGRVALLPFANSSLELGASAYGGKVGDRGDSLYANVGAFLYAFDLSYVRQVGFLGGTVDIKAQYNNTSVDKATYFEPETDTTFTPYSFDNQSYSYYAQLAYRPTKAGSNVLKNFELVGRYSFLQTPEGAEWETKASQWAVGINYWLSWRVVFKLNYQRTIAEGGHEVPAGVTTTTDGVFIHWAIGF